MTSSARASSMGGTSSPSARAVLRLYQLVLGRVLHRQIGRLLALEDAIDVAGRSPVRRNVIRAVGDQTAAAGEVRGSVHGGQMVAGRKRDDQIAMNNDDGDPTMIRPPFGTCANAMTARSISTGSRTSIGRNSTPNDGATAWMMAY
jgi:hypothetical protein